MTDLHDYLVHEYARRAYTHAYIFGYAEKGTIYAARVENATEILGAITYTDCASSKNGGTISLKYRQNKDRIALITSVASEIRPICSVENLENLFRNSRHNRGQIFESLTVEAFGAIKNPNDHDDFTKAGDLTIGGKAYQVKFNKATFTDLKTLRNLA